MATHLKLKHEVKERPLSDWSTIAVELLGSQMRIVQGPKWHHRVLEMGDGPPLFLYHGIGGHVDTYARTLPQLAKHFHVYAVDALFHGFSSKEGLDRPHMAVQQAAGFVDLLDALGYDKAHYEGESMGASIGFEIGMRYPERVNKIVLNGMGNIDTKRKEWKEQPFKGNLFDLSRAAVADPSYENIKKRLLWLVHNDDAINEEMIRIRQRLYMVPEVNESMRRVFGMTPETEGMIGTGASPYSEEEVRERWKTDTLVLYGEFNPGRGPDYGEYCADLLGAQFYEVKGTGHWPQWEKPDEYSEALLSYLCD